MRDVTQAVKSYIRRAETDYALMLEGGWGSGKTYYWKNTLIRLLKDEGYRPCYITLYGVKTIQEVADRILLGLRQVVYIKAAFDPLEIENFVEPKQLVLCFDDLERAEASIIHDIFGYLNIFTEHKLIKTIYLCNEERIKEYEEIKEQYAAAKEKVVGKTIRYEPEVEGTLRSIISGQSNKEYAEFLADNLDSLAELYSGLESSQRNYRSFKRALSDYLPIYRHLLDQDEETDREMLLKLLLFTIMLTLELKRQSNELTHSIGLAGTGVISRMSATMDEHNHLPRYRVYEYINKYLNHSILQGSIYYLASIAQYLVHGNLEEETLEHDIRDYKRALYNEANPIDLDNPDLERLVFDQYWLLSDEEFADAVGMVMGKLRIGEGYKLFDYARIFSVLKYFMDQGLMKNDEQELFESCKQGITGALDKLETDAEFDTFSLQFLSNAPLYKQLLDYIKEQLASRIENNRQSKAQELFQLLDTDGGAFAQKLYEARGEYYFPIFEHVHPGETAEAISRLSNPDIIKVRNAIANRYERSMDPSYRLDYEPLKQIKETLEWITGEKANDRLSTHLLKQLVESLETVLTNLEGKG